MASVADQVGLCSKLRTENGGLTTADDGSEECISVHYHVQDACSSDGTAEWLAEYVAQQPPTSNYQLSFASEADEGMYDAINKGVGFAMRNQVDEWRLLNDEDGRKKKAEKVPNNQQLLSKNSRDSVIAWLNCDEQYLPAMLQKVAEHFRSHPEVDFVYGNALLLDPDGALLTYRKNPPVLSNSTISAMCCVGQEPG